MQRRCRLAAPVGVVSLMLGAWIGIRSPAVAAQAACRPGSNDVVERAAPAALLPELARIFGLPVAALRSASYVRCSQGRLLACAVGANLSCGKADTRRRSAGGDAFCRENPGSAIVPLAATGHDTIYDWHCRGRMAVAGPPVTPVDRDGFIKGNWKPVR